MSFISLCWRTHVSSEVYITFNLIANKLNISLQKVLITYSLSIQKKTYLPVILHVYILCWNVFIFVICKIFNLDISKRNGFSYYSVKMVICLE